MSYVIDNGNPNPVSRGDRWTPKLKGNVFCSPACGFGCKKADFDRASARANALAANLGPGWQPDVWENGGWYWEVKKGAATVRPDDDDGFVADIRFSLDDVHETCVREARADPREAVEAVIAVLDRKVAVLKRALLSVSLAPAEIQDV